MKKFLPQQTASQVALALYAVVAAFTCVVGLRVVRTEWFYSGTYQQNYFAGLQPIDLIVFPALAVGIAAITLVLLALFLLLLERIPLRHAAANPAVVFCISWVVIFVCWVPYFLVNYPAALYADSIVIIKQALGINALTSHHPIAYVALVGVFLRLGDALFGSYILGIALYTAFQMVFMSGVFAYLLSWMAARRIPVPYIVVACVFFASMSLFPIHAVSMWKDGLYAACMLRVTLLVFDIVGSSGRALARPAVLARLALWGLAIALLRSNGIYVMALVWLALLAHTIVPKGQGVWHAWRARIGLVLACAVSLGGYFAVTGPLSDALEVKTEPVESYGIPLQQAAAVVVYDGAMTPQQRAFMDTLLPLDQYQEEYLPCSVDGIKWAPDFDTEFFDAHQREFLQVWANMAAANVRIYAAAYTMESYEYWSFADVRRTFTLNGVNDKYDAPDLGIIETNLLEAWFGDAAKGLFPFQFAHLQEGAMSWLVLCAGLVLFVARREAWPVAGQAVMGRHGLAHTGSAALPFARPWWLVLVPTVANWLTVLVSSPFAALPRYILPAYFIIPVLVVLPWLCCEFWPND